jgi:hypothetical protein
VREVTGLARLRSGVIGCALILAISALTGCQQTPPDRSVQADALVDQIRQLPGVRSASRDVADSVAQADVHFWLSVEMAEDATADQVAAVTTKYIDDLRTTGYPAYQTELDIHTGADLFAVDGGHDPLTNGDQIIAQARDWAALRSQFPSATVNLRAIVAHPADTQPTRNGSHPVLGAITLADPADYRDVSAAVGALGTRFPQLADGTWTVDASKSHPATITTSKRMPTGQELDVWNKVNADQTIPHIDAMTINAPATPPVWISEKTISRDLATSLRLATLQLPIVATLPAPVLYTATDQLQAHRNYDGHIIGPVAVTVGGCTPRNYGFDPAEKKLIDAYERCPRPKG